MDARVLVRLLEGSFEVAGLDLLQHIIDAVLRAGAPRPLGVLARGRVLVGEEADEPRPRAGDDGDIFSNLLAQRLGDDRRVDLVDCYRHLSF